MNHTTYDNLLSLLVCGKILISEWQSADIVKYINVKDKWHTPIDRPVYFFILCFFVTWLIFLALVDTLFVCLWKSAIYPVYKNISLITWIFIFSNLSKLGSYGDLLLLSIWYIMLYD